MTESPDALSDVLRLVRLRACVYFVRNMEPGWGLDAPACTHGPLHMVLQGRCILRHEGQDTALSAGDAVLLPRGAPHQMLGHEEARARPGPDEMNRLMGAPQPSPENTATRMLCGHFEWDGTLDHPIFGELPEVIVVRNVFDRDGAGLFRTVVDLIRNEQTGAAPGASAVADRMGEVLFVSLLRAWMAEHEPASGVLATMHDSKLSRALNYMHEHHAEPVDLNLLARKAGMSRTSFATRFHDTMGKPPATYLTEWRMLQARKMLVRSEAPISQITEAVGYGSDAAFVRAFKRRFGETPARLRRAAIGN